MIEVNVRLTKEMLLSIAAELAADRCGLDLHKTKDKDWAELHLRQLEPVWYGCESHEEAQEAYMNGCPVDEVKITFRTERRSWHQWKCSETDLDCEQS